MTTARPVTAKRRADGEGSIYKAGVYWVAAVSHRDPATGRRKQKTAKRRTKADALIALDQLRGRAKSGKPLRDSAMTLGDWSKRWETSVLKASHRRQTTKATYSALMKSAIRPYLGGMPLCDLHRSDVAGWLATLEAEGRLAASSRRQAFTVLRICLADAVEDGLLADNPAANVPRPRLERVEAHHYTADQVRLLVDAASDHRLRNLLLLLVGTGLRRGEALALRWENVDLSRGELRVRGTLVRASAGGGLVVNPPKTANGWRTVPLSDPVAAGLREQRAQQAADRLAAGPSWIGVADHVFMTEAGTLLDPRNVTRWFTGITKAAKVGGSLHSLRHTALTGMALAGVPLAVVSRIAGHESISTTIDLYGHLSEQAARDAVASAAIALGLG